MKLTLLLCMVLFSSLSFSKTSFVSKSESLNKKQHKFTLNNAFWLTFTRWDRNGVEKQLVDPDFYAQYDFGIYAGYGIEDGLEILYGANIRGNFSSFEFGNEDESVFGVGLESGHLGLKYLMGLSRHWQFSIRGLYFYPFHKAKPATATKSELTIGDGERVYTLGASLGYTSDSNNKLNVSAMFRSPGSSLSNEIVFDIEGALVWKSFALSSGVEYNWSLENDPYTNDPAGKPSLDQGATNMFNSINRYWLKPYAGIHFATSKEWRIELKGEYVLAGRSTDGGVRTIVNFAKRAGGVNKLEEKRLKFKSYEVDAVVKKMSSKGKYAVVNKGAIAGVRQGMRFDFYYFDFLGGNKLIGSGKAVKVGSSKSIVEVITRVSKRRIKKGTVARGGMIKN